MGKLKMTIKCRDCDGEGCTECKGTGWLPVTKTNVRKQVREILEIKDRFSEIDKIERK